MAQTSLIRADELAEGFTIQDQQQRKILIVCQPILINGLIQFDGIYIDVKGVQLPQLMRARPSKRFVLLNYEPAPAA